MIETIFILGREPELSVAELESLAGLSDGQVVVLNDQAALLSHRKELPEKFIDYLGGSLKQVKVVAHWPKDDLVYRVIENNFSADLVLANVPDGRIEIGASLYGGSRGDQQKLDRRLMWLKKQLVAADRPTRIVTSKEPQLSSVTVQRNGLLKQGREFVFAVSDEEIIVGQTIAVQDYELYSLRDFGRPAADPKKGMLPPKVAQVMLNVASTKPTDVVLDPFCGVGTVVQEALWMGVKEVHGSDNDQEAVKASQTNMRWLFKEFPDIKATVEIIVGDARQSRTKPNVIVTEPYLGKPLYGNEKVDWLEQQAADIANLYLQVFRQWKTILKPGGRIVMIWPEFVSGEAKINLNLTKLVTDLGFVQQPLLSVPTAKKLNVDRFVLNYGRNDAHVRREIRRWVLES